MVNRQHAVVLWPETWRGDVARERGRHALLKQREDLSNTTKEIATIFVCYSANFKHQTFDFRKYHSSDSCRHFTGKVGKPRCTWDREHASMNGWIQDDIDLKTMGYGCNESEKTTTVSR